MIDYSKRKITGECACGSVKYSIEGDLKDARSCHCSMCRRIFSAQASACAEVDPETFTWISGRDNLRDYVGEQGYGIQFCQTCGSTMSIIYNDVIHSVTLGCVNGDPGVEIDRHIFVGSKASWEKMPEGVTQYDAYPPE